MDTKKTRLLIIDDEEAILFAFKDVLSEPWLVVDTASSLEDARIHIATFAYDAAVVDLRLGGSNDFEGFEAIKMVKRANPHCKIIMLTAFAKSDTKEEAFTVGADYFLEKPASPEEIRSIFTALGVF